MKTRFSLIFIVAFIYISSATVFAQIVSDDFSPETTIQTPWSFYDPLGDATLTLTGTNAEISVPAGTSHDLYDSNRDAPRLLQPAPDSDFQIEVKFESAMSANIQVQGVIVQVTNDTFLRFDAFYSGGYKLFSAFIDGTASPDVKLNGTASVTPNYLRVTRVGDDWTFEYSDDGSAWVTATTFTHVLTVNEVGFYAGNAGGGLPAHTASVDYFWNTADAGFTDTDTPGGSPPVIDVWYGDNQTFGNIGNPQNWVNILGRVTDANGISSLTYSLNGGSDVSLALGANGTRLVGEGDFVTEIDYADLNDGVNTVEFTATDGVGSQSTKTVTLNYEAGNVWPLPYTVDFTSLSSIEDVNSVANIVDGLWELTGDGIRTTEPGYDRLIVIGDETWTTNYEVTAEMTINSISGGSGVGFAMGWQGHTGTASPRTQWPLEAIGWVWQSSGLEIWTYPNGKPASTSYALNPNTTYFLKAKSEDVGGGNSRYSLKIWKDGESEPSNYMIDAVIPDRDGSVLLITHKADVTWKTIQIDPLTGNFDPSFTSSPVITAQEGQAYSYNISASDPNAADVLSISANTLPSWLSFNDNGDGTADLTGTPGMTDLGNHPVELEVSDGNGGSATQNFTIVVTSTSANLPLSDQFCGPAIEPFWTIYDPYSGGAGESTFGINNGVLEIDIPSGVSHDLGGNDAPRLLQTIPDDDFGIEVKFNSVPSSTYQMQGIVVQAAGGVWLRFETFYGTIGSYTGEHFLANGYGGVAFGGQFITQVGGAIPEYLRLIRTGNVFEFDFSYDGITWSNIITKTLNVTVNEVGFYGANHNPNPAFTVQAEYFRNLDDPIPSCSVVEVTAPNGGEVWSGGGTENITWTSTDVTNVNIEFSSDNGSSWTTVATAINASTGTFAYNVPNITSTDCLVRISDTDNSSVFDISDATFTINQALVDPTITIGSATTVAGSYVTIPIDLSAPSGFKIDYLLQGKVNFDASKLKFLYGDYDTGTLVNDFGWTGTLYSAIPGTVDIILSGNSAMDNTGTLFYLTFQVIDGNAGSADLTSTSAEWPVDVLESPLTVVNGSVTYSDNSGTSANRGDATLNFIVDIYDALAVIYHWVGLQPLTGQAFTNADADLDGDVDIDDYLKIIFFVYLHDWDYAFPSVSPSSSIVLTGAGFESSDVISVPIVLTNASNVQSVEVEFDYDPTQIEFRNVVSNGGDLRTADNNGQLSLIASSTNEVQNGEIASVRFKKLNGNLEAEVTASYKLNNGQVSDQNTLSIGDGTITSVNDVDAAPVEFELSQNYPNPFNPSTLIKFAVPNSGNYQLNVYNVLGQKVMTLINGQLKAGYHSAMFDGTKLASGVYIYSLEGADVNISKKMLLIK